MFRIPTLLLLVGSLCAAIAGDGGVAIGDAVLRPIIPEREHIANRAIEAFERDHATIRALPMDQRRTREQRLGPTLERLVSQAEETKAENKALYLLAHWRFMYQDGRHVEPLLDRIRRNPYPGFKNPAEALRVQLYLRQGRLGEAREITNRLVASVPELAGLAELCAFYERIGQQAPRTAGTPLGTAPADPALRSEPWLLYHFTGSLDANQREALKNLLEEVGKPAYADLLRVVVVAEGANPLALLGGVQDIPGSDRVDLLWSNPAPEGDAGAWRSAWNIPQLPAQVLLGPDRRVVAVQPSLDDLRVLIGRGSRPAATPARPTGRGPKGG